MLGRMLELILFISFLTFPLTMKLVFLIASAGWVVLIVQNYTVNDYLYSILLLLALVLVDHCMRFD